MQQIQTLAWFGHARVFAFDRASFPVYANAAGTGGIMGEWHNKELESCRGTSTCGL